MYVSPFNHLAATPKNFVIVNLESTSYDYYATMVFNTTCDGFMKNLMKELKLSVPDYLYQQVKIIK
jgi:NAD-dependent SIR2 family protein deacetylase